MTNMVMGQDETPAKFASIIFEAATELKERKWPINTELQIATFLDGLPGDYENFVSGFYANTDSSMNIEFEEAVKRARAYHDTVLSKKKHVQKSSNAVSNLENKLKMFRVSEDGKSPISDAMASLSQKDLKTLLRVAARRSGPRAPGSDPRSCNNFARGHCSYGSKCIFQHGKVEEKNCVPVNKEQKTSTKFDGNCWICSMKGHRSNNCPNRDTQTQSSSPVMRIINDKSKMFLNSKHLKSVDQVTDCPISDVKVISDGGSAVHCVPGVEFLLPGSITKRSMLLT